MKLSFAPAIRVHCWGGFGSQLFAVIQCWYLADRFPTRKIVLIIHTSGVTKRNVEITELLSGFRVITKNDFKEPSTINLGASHRASYSEKMKGIAIRISKYFLIRMGFISSLKDENALKSLKPWIVSLRGHYTNLPLARSHLIKLRDAIVEQAGALTTPKIARQTLAVQYRLGDLLNLKQKSFIEPELLTNVVSDQLNPVEIKDITILSDSPKEATELLDANRRGWTVKNLSPIETIDFCLTSKRFVGTNSKLSFWIAIFRTLNEQKSILPKGFKVKIHSAIDAHAVQNIDFFETGN